MVLFAILYWDELFFALSSPSFLAPLWNLEAFSASSSELFMMERETAETGSLKK